MMTTLMYIQKNPGCMKTDVYDAVSRNPKMPEKFQVLQSMGLLEQRTMDSRGKTSLCLTEKGNRVASLLENLEVELNTI